MSINTAHANNGVLIHAGECIILFSDNVTIDFNGQDGPLFKGTKQGRVYLTTHRIIFNSKLSTDPLQSASFPFVCLTDVEVEQPMFGANYIKGKVRAQDNGNFTGEVKFKMVFKAGGAIDFAQAALKAAYIAKKYGPGGPPPPYTPPTGAWYEAPPPAYEANPTGYYGWVPNTAAFPGGPPPNTVFMTDNPPPYPGIAPGTQASNGYPGGPPSYGQAAANAGYPAWGNPEYQQGAPGGPGYPNGSQGYPQGGPGYPQGGPGYPQGGPGYPQGGPGYPQGGPGYPQGGPGYPQGGPGYPQPGQGYPQGGPGYPQGGHGYPQGGSGYPSGGQGAAGGFAPPPGMNSKETEAAQSAYYDPNKPQTAYVPPPAYYEPPPSYNSLPNKKEQ